jgi:formate/nitrite transporter FocA (FNT family)
LFTEQTSLAVMAVLNRRATVRALLRLWSIVYAGNLVGAALFAAFTVFAGPRLQVIDRRAFGVIAGKAADHPALVIFMSGILAAWLMGLLSWLVAAGRDTISQIVIVWLITAGIGLGHFHHVVLGTAETLSGVFSGHTTILSFGHFLFWTTIGNSIGGPVFVALLKNANLPSAQPS